MKAFIALILLIFSFNIHAEDFYIATTDLNLRSGPSNKHESIVIIEKGDTVSILDDTQEYWVKIQYQDKVGYSAKQYLFKINSVEKIIEPTIEGFSFTYLIFLLIIIYAASSIYKYGESNRSKLIASVLALFFGALGFQKFYLGQKNKGILSILFCWTLIPVLIGLIDFIKISFMKKTEFDYAYNPQFISTNESNNIIPKKPSNIPVKPNITIRSKTNYRNLNQASDNSIIDINSEDLDLSVEKKPLTHDPLMEPPFWRHTYVYSNRELQHASKEQRKYYSYFKNKVLNEAFVDIDNNTNYAFILYFDFLNEYKHHRDIKLLERQFKLLGKICPQTKNYSDQSLQDELRIRDDTYSVEKLKDLQETTYYYTNDAYDYNPNLYKLGSLYKDKLKLDKVEISRLNKFHNPSNVFLSIEGCCKATILQYNAVLKELDKQLLKEKTTLAKQVNPLKNKLKAKYLIKYSSWGYYDKNSFGYESESEIYLTIFKRVENSVRDILGHKRKVSGDFFNEDPKLNIEFDNRIGDKVDALIAELRSNVSPPDLAMEIALNAQNVNRWKIEFDALKSNFNNEKKDNFFDGVISLEESNQKNPNIEHIFFDSSKFIAKYDKVQALKYYTQYIYYDLKSKKIDSKELNKTVKKSLFKNAEQINDFKKIIAELIESQDIQKALDKVSKLYIPKRKKIKLNRSEIKKVEQKHKHTVELLDDFLSDKKDNITPESDENISENDKVEILPTMETNSIYISTISLGQIQEDLVKIIVNDNYEIQQDVVDQFAIENGMFKNQLIDSINVACEDALDGSVLIEEDGDMYVIEESYYKYILK